MPVLLAVLFSLLQFVASVDAQPVFDAGESFSGDRRPLMRAHLQRGAESPSVVHLGPSGDLIEVRAHISGGRARADPATAFDDLCKYSFILGKEDSNECKDTNLHENILDREDCKFAAEQAGACKGPCGGCATEMDIGLNCDGTERIDATGEDGRYNTHPIGCFKAKGTKNRTEFYYNPGEKPQKPERNGGVPICQRRRFLNGTDGADGGCPDGYEKVMDFDMCRTAAICEGYDVDDNQFMVGVPPTEPNNDPRPDWMRKYDGKPRGCFIKHDTGNPDVYFNKPRENPPSGIVKGNTPICNITRWAE